MYHVKLQKYYMGYFSRKIYYRSCKSDTSSNPLQQTIDLPLLSFEISCTLRCGMSRLISCISRLLSYMSSLIDFDRLHVKIIIYMTVDRVKLHFDIILFLKTKSEMAEVCLHTFIILHVLFRSESVCSYIDTVRERYTTRCKNIFGWGWCTRHR